MSKPTKEGLPQSNPARATKHSGKCPFYSKRQRPLWLGLCLLRKIRHRPAVRTEVLPADRRLAGLLAYSSRTIGTYVPACFIGSLVFSSGHGLAWLAAQCGPFHLSLVECRQAITREPPCALSAKPLAHIDGSLVIV